MNRPTARILIIVGFLVTIAAIVALVFYSQDALQFASGSFQSNSISKATFIDLETLSDTAFVQTATEAQSKNRAIVIANVSRGTTTTCIDYSFETMPNFPQKPLSFLTETRKFGTSVYIGLVSNLALNCMSSNSLYSQRLDATTGLILRQSVESGLTNAQSFKGFLVPLDIHLYSTEAKETTSILDYYKKVTAFTDVSSNNVAIYALLNVEKIDKDAPQLDVLTRLKEFVSATGVTGVILTGNTTTANSLGEYINKNSTVPVVVME